MPKTTSFSVYNASAGSGKTYTLVKEYLKLIFESKRHDQFRNILALTFTNKAVGEMKTRIIDTLKQFSDEAILTAPNSMFSAISKELEMPPEALNKASTQTLQAMLHNYAAFDISTIDKFTHKIIRTFAFDLKIPVNFEVELDTDNLLSEAVERLIAKAGSDKELTKVLVAFAIEKADDDKSWDISYDFNKISRLLVNENDLPFLELMKHKTLDDFNSLKTLLNSKIATSEKTIISKAEEALQLIEECGLQFDDFTRGSLPKYFESLANANFDMKFDTNWQLDIENTILYPKRVSEEIASTINAIRPQLIQAFLETKKFVFQQRFYKNFYKNLTPLSVLNAINNELSELKDENDLILISDFNSTIHKVIKDQPTPFIYERLGEKFRHYFIDEFQDTSELQWENLIPLLDNSLSSETGSAMIVGDAKQAIYRWRGGKPELFIDLVNNRNPFQVEKSLHTLPTNYRSCRNIVEFNNNFFKHLASFVFQDDKHKDLYNAAIQNHFHQEEGFVNIKFLSFDDGDLRDERYCEEVKHTVESVLANGFELRDICVLVRKKKEGVAIAQYLTEHQIEIISSETLLLSRSPEVVFITNIFQLSIQPENKELKADVLYYIAKNLEIEDAHAFIMDHLNSNLEALSFALKAFGIHFKFPQIAQSPLYDAAEYIIKQFDLIKNSDAYVQFYLDTILDFSQNYSSDILGFLSYWEKKKKSLSITMPAGKNALQIITIHKSKGLEFPVVIFPYADLNIYSETDPKIWFPLDRAEFNGFSHTLLNYNKNIVEFNEIGHSIYQHRQSELELDTLNILYVTLTRPIEQLYIISKNNCDAKGNEKLNDYSGLFINFLKNIGEWSDSKDQYSFGNPKNQLDHSSGGSTTQTPETYISDQSVINIITKSGYLWDTAQKEAIEKGNLVHNIMSRIYVANDMDFALKDAFSEGLINQEQEVILKSTISSIIHHDAIKDYFKSDLTVYNERDIISTNGLMIRPDRLVVDKNNNAIIIDYKTGSFNISHVQQLTNYATIIASMNFVVKKKILVYINDDIEIKEV